MDCSAAMNLLPFTIYLSFAGAALALVAGQRSAATARMVALLTAATAWGLTLYAAAGFTPSASVLTLINLPWIPQMGINYHLAVDGISLTLLVLTGLAATAGVLFSWNIEERTGEFFAFYLALIGGVYGVFLSADAFLFFVFYEIAIVPKYFLIANWGSTNRQYGAMKLALYSFAGSALVLAGLLWIYATGHATGGHEGAGQQEERLRLANLLRVRLDQLANLPSHPHISARREELLNILQALSHP
jgi:NADH-quinone oxidoreductase subunit M